MAQAAGGRVRIHQGEVIAMEVTSSVAVTIFAHVDIVYDDGTNDTIYIDDQLSGSSRVLQRFFSSEIAQDDGYITGGQVDLRTNTTRGTTYATFSVRSSRAGTNLGKGYVYTGKTVSLGEFEEPGPAGGHGQIRVIQLADPAAAAEVAAVAAPAGAFWRVHTFSVQLVQGITQTPLPTLRIRDSSANIRSQVPITTTAIGASSTAQLTWGRGLVQSSFTAVVGDEFHTAPMPDSIMANQDDIGTLTDGIGANTNYGIATLVVEEWVMPN